jgi:hypothetical protein
MDNNPYVIQQTYEAKSKPKLKKDDGGKLTPGQAIILVAGVLLAGMFAFGVINASSRPEPSSRDRWNARVEDARQAACKDLIRRNTAISTNVCDDMYGK